MLRKFFPNGLGRGVLTGRNRGESTNQVTEPAVGSMHQSPGSEPLMIPVEETAVAESSHVRFKKANISRMGEFVLRAGTEETPEDLINKRMHPGELRQLLSLTAVRAMSVDDAHQAEGASLSKDIGGHLASHFVALDSHVAADPDKFVSFSGLHDPEVQDGDVLRAINDAYAAVAASQQKYNYGSN